MITEDNGWRHDYVNGVAPRHRYHGYDAWPCCMALNYIATTWSLLDTPFGDERGIMKVATMMRNQGMDS